MKSPRKEKIRLTVDLQPRFYQRLSELEALVEANSKADLIRDSLRLYDAMVTKVLDGQKICAIDESGRSTEILFLGPLPQSD